LQQQHKTYTVLHSRRRLGAVGDEIKLSESLAAKYLELGLIKEVEIDTVKRSDPISG